MLVRLKNFKQHAHLELKLPDSGLVLIKGISGAGKSTVVEAIYDAWYEGNTAAKVKPWSGGAPAVTVESARPEAMKVVRTRSPNTLQVETLAGVFRDDSAETEIQRVLGMNKGEFLASSYIRQRMDGSLLKLGPAEQLRFIQRLAFQGEDPETTRAKITAGIAHTKSEITWKTAALADAESNEKSAAERVARESSALVEPVAPFSAEDAAAIEAKLTESTELSTRLRQMIQDIDVKLSNPLYKKLSVLESLERQTSDLLKAESERLTSFQAAVKEMSEQLAALPAIDFLGQMAAIETKRTWFKNCTAAGNLVEAVKKTFPTTEPLSASAILKNVIAEADAAYSGSTAKAATLMAEFSALETTPDGQPCPGCGIELSIRSGKIHKHDGSSAEKQKRLADIRAELALLAPITKDADVKAKAARAFLTQVESIKSLIQIDPMPAIKTEDELNAFSKDLGDKMAARSAAKSQSDEMGRQVAQSAVKIKKFEGELAAIAADATAAKALTPAAGLELLKAETFASMNAVAGTVTALSLQTEKIRAHKLEMSRYAAAQSVVKTLNDLLGEAKAKTVTAKANLLTSIKRLGAQTRIKELSDKAAVEAVDGIIEDINRNAQKYIDQLFPDDGTVVRILNLTKTTKGEDRAKLSLDIVHKGQEVGSDLGELSGGEQDRIVLAFQLSLSDMYGSPILFVDEGFTGADFIKTLDLGLGVLKEISQTKLVVVIQHGSPEGIYDEIIEL